MQTTSNSPFRVLFASLIGTTIEFFDFYIYATAAVLVFPKLFFPAGDATIAALQSLATFALAFFDRVRVMVAWCELRQGYRHFRTDRISNLRVDELGYPRRRQVMLKEWRAIEGVPPPDKN